MWALPLEQPLRRQNRVPFEGYSMNNNRCAQMQPTTFRAVNCEMHIVRVRLKSKTIRIDSFSSLTGMCRPFFPFRCERNEDEFKCCQKGMWCTAKIRKIFPMEWFVATFPHSMPIPSIAALQIGSFQVRLWSRFQFVCSSISACGAATWWLSFHFIFLLRAFHHAAFYVLFYLFWCIFFFHFTLCFCYLTCVCIRLLSNLEWK